MKIANPLYRPCPWEVGDILTTENATPPAQRWPGTQWVQITDCFIRAADSAHKAGTTGGSWTHVQTLDEMANHEHGGSWDGGRLMLWDSEPLYDGQQDFAVGSGITLGYAWDKKTRAAGGGNPMDITNKYRAAYIWLRTS